jgi:TctA family transporter
MKEIDWEAVKKLYDAGQTDRSIGQRFQCGYRKIYKWRHKNGLPANHIGKKRLVTGVLVGAGAAVAAMAIYKEVKKRSRDKKEKLETNE